MSGPASAGSRPIYEGPDYRVRLMRYGPGLRQAAHGHVEPSLSVLLAGAFREDCEGEDRTVFSGAIGTKPPQARHAVAFGPDGAMILSVEARRDEEAWPQPPAWGRAPRAATDLAHLCVSLGEEAVLADLVADLAAAATPAEDGGAAPSWVGRCRDRMLAEPASVSMTALASEAGVHPSQLTRTFVRAFGEAPSVFRLRRMADRALALVLEGRVSLAAAAHEAGFSDQSHMSRAIKTFCGLTPGAARQRFAA